MTPEARCERTAELLAARLDELASALERSGAPTAQITRLLELASIATLHAVRLDLLTAGGASATWAEVAEGQPALATAQPVRARRAA